MSIKDEKEGRIDCLKCIYYAVSWDPNFPRACKLYGFKTAYMPSATVYRSSGAECMGFVKKGSKKGQADV